MENQKCSTEMESGFSKSCRPTTRTSKTRGKMQKTLTAFLIMALVAAALLAPGVHMALATQSTEVKAAAYKAYYDILVENKNYIMESPGGSYFLLIDFDNNGIPELVCIGSFEFVIIEVIGYTGDIVEYYEGYSDGRYFLSHVTAMENWDPESWNSGNTYDSSFYFAKGNNGIIYLVVSKGEYNSSKYQGTSAEGALFQGTGTDITHYYTIQGGEWVSVLNCTKKFNYVDCLGALDMGDYFMDNPGVFLKSSESETYEWLVGDVSVSEQVYNSAPEKELGITGRYDTSENRYYLAEDILTELQSLQSATGTDDLPSSWAVDQVNAAIAANLVPQAMQSAYTQATTRAEFCALAVALFETVTDGEITERQTFSDTDDVNVEKMAALGVVYGIGENMFAPNDALTREQAATMLSRLADALEKPLTQQEAAFSDNAQISSWAFDAVGQMQATGIMGGVGDNIFAPKSDYTREQSIMTILRLYDIVS